MPRAYREGGGRRRGGQRAEGDPADRGEAGHGGVEDGPGRRAGSDLGQGVLDGGEGGRAQASDTGRGEQVVQRPVLLGRSEPDGEAGKLLRGQRRLRRQRVSGGQGGDQRVGPQREQVQAGGAGEDADEGGVEFAGAYGREAVVQRAGGEAYRQAGGLQDAVEPVAEALAGADAQSRRFCARGDLAGELPYALCRVEGGPRLGQQAFTRGVRRTCRVVRWKRATPSSRSRRLICWLTPGCTMCSCSAARLKLSSAATVAK